MTTIVKRFNVEKAIGGGTISHRWNLIQDISNVPQSGSFTEFNKHFSDNPHRKFALRDANRLLTQWGFTGWIPVIDDKGNWDLKNAFNKSRGKYNFISNVGLDFAKLLGLVELSKTSKKFSDIFDECQKTIQHIRCHIYEDRWKKHAFNCLSGKGMDARSNGDYQAIIVDLFRLLCFDFLVRKRTLDYEEICIISNVVQDPSKYGVNDLITFREMVDLYSDEWKQKRLKIKIPDNWEPKNSYHFHEFLGYKQTYGIKIFSAVEGTYKGGFRYNGAEDCFTELQQRLEEY